MKMVMLRGYVEIKKKNKTIARGWGTFTRQARDLLQVLFLEYSDAPMGIALVDVNGNKFEVYVRGRFDTTPFYHIYTVSGADLPSRLGLRFYLSNSAVPYSVTDFELRSIVASGELRVRAIRDGVTMSSLSFSGSFTVESDTYATYALITNTILDRSGNARELLVDYVSLGRVELGTGESYDIIYTVTLA